MKAFALFKIFAFSLYIFSQTIKDLLTLPVLIPGEKRKLT